MAEEINPKDPARAAEATLSRREAMLQILRLGAVATTASGIGLWLHSRSARPEPRAAEAARKDHRITAAVEWPSMAVAQYPAESRAAEVDEPRALVQAALKDLGGMSRFVKPQDVVVIKPNIAWDRTPEQAANTNPELVAEVVRQCREAGAKRVTVTDVSCNEARRCFIALSG